jgi:hypothetical protein
MKNEMKKKFFLDESNLVSSSPVTQTHSNIHYQNQLAEQPQQSSPINQSSAQINQLARSASSASQQHAGITSVVDSNEFRPIVSSSSVNSSKQV